MKTSLLRQGELAAMSSIDKVLYFWDHVWSAPYHIDLIDELMTDDFIITNAGSEIQGRENFKLWVASLLSVVRESNLENLEIFESQDGTRVVSRWIFSGLNYGIFNLPAAGQPISFTGTAIWEIRDGKLAHNWVERSALELYQQLQDRSAT
ncbi:ester cyclase [Mucilaginibacter jinjuensis]|uniref:Ester cyclase n=1 Tax=Mucilaginibacter jinjuensis TaxID=1176721 RepID=A0ABY7TDV9_9SPHI|nr:ester cyclase [Mucilaginibacter jinjuensis]WCT13357.1 ester cyclase [Mucilaginibacter jinjuensis]